MAQILEFPIVEEWTHGDPLVSELETIKRDSVAMAREIVRLRAIERASAKLMQHHAVGEVLAQAPLACLAAVELETALGSGRQWSLL